MKNVFSLVLLPLLAVNLLLTASAADRPNILWLTSEDNGPQLGCYGDAYATTPNIDGLAAKGLLYKKCWSTAPVCAPARTTLISGIYPPSSGGQHMRSTVSLPAAFKMYPQYLREAGYYCTNNSKEDYNLAKPGKVWDESSKKAHWKNRKDGQPFFAVFNYTVSHESQVRKRPHQAVHDPAKVRVPAYHPDAPEVRQDWAQYYDKLTLMDGMVGEALKELADAGLAEDTIVFYYGDHGPGMPRNKRWTYNSGLHVPLVIHVPEKFKALAPQDYAAGAKTDRLVGFVDFPATALSLVGVKPPEHFQGHAFMGKHEAAPQSFLFGFRDRMDERIDLCRAVTDGRYVYVRNFMPHKPWGIHMNYLWKTPTTRVWEQQFKDGKLNKGQSLFWQVKPPEELYDLQSDPDEVVNLAKSLKHVGTMNMMREEQRKWAKRVLDVGMLPEGEIHTRSEGSTPYEMARAAGKFPFEQIFHVAELASKPKAAGAHILRDYAKHEDSAVRFWAVTGILIRGKGAVTDSREALVKALGDESPHVRIAAAEAIGMYGDEVDLPKALGVLLKAADPEAGSAYVAIQAWNAIDLLDEKAIPIKAALMKLPKKDSKAAGRANGYVSRLMEKTLGDLAVE